MSPEGPAGNGPSSSRGPASSAADGYWSSRPAREAALRVVGDDWATPARLPVGYDPVIEAHSG